MCELTPGTQQVLTQGDRRSFPHRGEAMPQAFFASFLRHRDGGMGSLGLFLHGGECSCLGAQIGPSSGPGPGTCYFCDFNFSEPHCPHM